MGRIIDTVRTFNSLARTLLFGLLMAAAGFVGWQGYTLYFEPRQKLAEQEFELTMMREELKQADKDLAAREQEVAAISADLKEKSEQLERTETSLRLLKLRHRIARLRVVDQAIPPGSLGVVSTIEFYEVNDDGAPLSDERKTFAIAGDRVYVECLVAKFEDKYIEQADLDRSTAICLFQRIFGEYQEPQEGFPIDNVGASLAASAGGKPMPEFERRIWRDFWNIANDREKAAELGIRAAHADAPSMRVEKGATYELELRATGEFTLRRLEDHPTLLREASDPAA
jgi:hypothetical protein